MHEGVFEGIEKFRRRLTEGETLIGSGISLTDAQVTAVKAQFQLKQITGSGECVSPSSRAV